MAGVIEGFRWALTGQGLAPGSLFAASGCGVIVVLLGGMVYFRRMESTVADLV
jgi:lipopolysaccharide transport system permease protein